MCSDDVAASTGGQAVGSRRVWWWWTAALIALVAGVLWWAGISPVRWNFFAVLALDPLFADVAAVLAASEASARGLDPYLPGNPFDPFGRPHVYGPWWLALGELGLGVKHTAWAGWVTMVVFVGGIGRLFRPAGAGGFLLAAGLLLSPPVLLGINRANNDLVIVSMTLAAAWLSARPSRLSAAAALGVTGTSMLLKFYPIAQFASVFTMPGVPVRKLRLRACCLALVVAAVACVQAEEYFKAARLAPNYLTIHGYGVGFAFDFFGFLWSALSLAQLWGFYLGAVLALVFLWAGRRGWSDFLPEQGGRAFFAVACAATWVACLLAGTSFGYRVVWLLPLAALAHYRRGAADSAWIALVLALVWSWWPKEYFSRDLDRLPAEAQVWAANFAAFEQCLALATWVACLWMLIGWARRRLATWRDGG